MKLVAAFEKADIPWCAIGGVAVNHWAEHPMVTQDVDLVVAAEAVDQAITVLEQVGFKAERFPWSVNLKGRSAVSVQISTETFYQAFPARSVPADVHGILLRVASLEDTLRGKIRAWSDAQRRQSKRIKDLADIARLVESHSRLWALLPEELKTRIEQPKPQRGAS
ncbi:MAG: nucleotidyl transferase AbiEii/AbiGii toxin family protein [Candidatus Marinimicrobia bacterium]|nr:nucleotidyl transferase AbiEii/AbiGii toxin family protein [Candidatus Neomarinimicrobiota bacterium]